MGVGKLIAIIGGILGILSIVLFHVLPEFFGFWRLDAGAALTIWLGGFGFTGGEFMGIGIDPEYAEEIIFLLIAILVVAGGALAIVGGLVENKMIAILGGVVMLAGPIIFIIGAAVEFGPFEDLAAMLPPDSSLLFGSAAGGDWGLYVGTFLALGAGVLGLIGGIKVED